jgi:hypothetical protein
MVSGFPPEEHYLGVLRAYYIINRLRPRAVVQWSVAREKAVSAFWRADESLDNTGWPRLAAASALSCGARHAMLELREM